MIKILRLRGDPSGDAAADAMLRSAGLAPAESVPVADAASIGAAARPDVLVLDADLDPGAAAAACRALRGNPAVAGVPLVVLTPAPLADDDQAAVLEAGASVVLVAAGPRAIAATLRSLGTLRAAGSPAAPTTPTQADFAAALELPNIGFAQVNVATRRLVRVNPGYCAITGYSEEELIDRMPVTDLTHPEDRPGDIERYERFLAGAGDYAVEKRYIRKDGSVAWVQVTAALVRGADGSVERTVAVVLDITARKRADAEREALLREAQAARAEAEDANRAKDQFLAMLGHELRNPLAAVHGAVLTARLDPTRSGRALDIAKRQAEQLSRIVDDLLDVARISQGRVALRRERADLRRIADRAIDSCRTLVDSRHHVLSVAYPREPLEVEVDAGRLEQVIANLIANAAKFTDPGGRIQVTLARDDVGNEAVLRVRDSGIGIAPALLPRVFDLFAQGERGLDRAHGGLGIGLTVARRLVELHGGRIAAYSPGLGAGAEFVVHLPSPPPAGAQAGAPSTVAPAGRARILVVEDNLDAAESMQMLLELLGHDVRVAYDGINALEVAQTERPDVMLVDIGLPGIDGYEVARRVRAQQALADVRLVAITGYGREEDRNKAMSAGFDDHLVKPVELDVLKQALAHEPRRDPDDGQSASGVPA